VKLNIIEAGHWEVAQIPYPNKIVKTKTKKRALSMLLHPSDREEFFDGITMGEDMSTDAINNNLLQGNPIKADEPITPTSKDEKTKQDQYKSKVINPAFKKIQDQMKKARKDLEDREKQGIEDQKKNQNMSGTVKLLSKQLMDMQRVLR
jgi:hypothetical protein